MGRCDLGNGREASTIAFRCAEIGNRTTGTGDAGLLDAQFLGPDAGLLVLGALEGGLALTL